MTNLDAVYLGIEKVMSPYSLKTALHQVRYNSYRVEISYVPRNTTKSLFLEEWQEFSTRNI